MIAEPFTDEATLKDAFSKVVSKREMLRTQMIALQEEMDWLVYEAYGLIDEKADCKMESDDLPEPLSLGQRPFEIWTNAKEDLNAASELIPEDWGEDRRRLWINRFIAIRDNEHIQRIEKPVYKRRWYQPASYEKQFEKAYEWWLLEKAEWWLEKKKDGGPITIEDWAEALWEDNRIQAASEVAKKANNLESFSKVLKRVVNGTTVPEDIPFAVPWNELTSKKIKVPAKVKNIRGKLNVPRERFRLKGKNEYLWAGLDWKQSGTNDDIRKDSGQAGMTKPNIDDWRTWQSLSTWAKTAPVNTYWIDFASTISNKIKKGAKLSQKDQENMKKCWKQAVNNGFEIR